MLRPTAQRESRGEENAVTFPTYRGEVPYLTTEQMVEVDRAMIEDFGIELIQMMENAGRGLAHLGRVRFFGGDPRGKRVTVLAGDGGGAMACARRLQNWGARVRVLVTEADGGFAPVPAQQLRILRRMGVEVESSDTAVRDSDHDLIIDGLIGYSLKGAPRGTAGELIRWADAQNAPVLALDAPSGVDTTTGTVFDPAIAATATMTLALPKEGLRAPGVEAQVGELYLADIGVPPSLYAGPALGLQLGHVFSGSDIVRLP